MAMIMGPFYYYVMEKESCYIITTSLLVLLVCVRETGNSCVVPFPFPVNEHGSLLS